MSSVFFFTRRILPTILILFSSTILWAQAILLCNTCDEATLHATKTTQGIKAFKCKASLPNLVSVYKWGVLDAKGTVLVKPEWDSISSVTTNSAVVYQYLSQRKKTTLKSGLLSFENKVLLPLNYNSIHLLQNSYYRVNSGKGFQIWQVQKGFLNTAFYDSIVVSSIGILLYKDQLCHRINVSSGLLEEGNLKAWLQNDSGRIYSTSYDTLYLYRAGDKGLTEVLADSIQDGKIKREIFLSRNEKQLVWNFPEQASFLSIEKHANSQFVNLNTLSDSTLLKIKTRTLADTILLLSDIFLFKRNKFWGYGDTIGNVTIAPVYDSLGLMYKDRVAVKIRNKWGFLDNREHIIAQPYYTEVGDYRYGATWVVQNKKYNFLDLAGKVINTYWYDSMLVTQSNYVVYYKERAGLVNHLGQEIIGTRYLQVLDFNEGACLVQTEDLKWFLMDYKENRISKHPYSNVYYLPISKVYVLKK